MDRLRIGVIGLGWFGEIYAETIASVPNLELATLCTRTSDRLKAMGEKFGVARLYRDYNDLLADPGIDAVSICTMWDQHTEPAIAALKAGKHVFLEKPIASTVADARKITAASKGAKGILFIGHVVRFNPRTVPCALHSATKYDPIRYVSIAQPAATRCPPPRSVYERGGAS